MREGRAYVNIWFVSCALKWPEWWRCEGQKASMKSPRIITYGSMGFVISRARASVQHTS